MQNQKQKCSQEKNPCKKKSKSTYWSSMASAKMPDMAQIEGILKKNFDACLKCHEWIDKKEAFEEEEKARRLKQLVEKQKECVRINEKKKEIQEKQEKQEEIEKIVKKELEALKTKEEGKSKKEIEYLKLELEEMKRKEKEDLKCLEKERKEMEVKKRKENEELQNKEDLRRKDIEKNKKLCDMKRKELGDEKKREAEMKKKEFEEMRRAEIESFEKKIEEMVERKWNEKTDKNSCYIDEEKVFEIFEKRFCERNGNFNCELEEVHDLIKDKISERSREPRTCGNDVYRNAYKKPKNVGKVMKIDCKSKPDVKPTSNKSLQNNGPMHVEDEEEEDDDGGDGGGEFEGCCGCEDVKDAIYEMIENKLSQKIEEKLKEQLKRDERIRLEREEKERLEKERAEQQKKEFEDEIQRRLALEIERREREKEEEKLRQEREEEMRRQEELRIEEVLRKQELKKQEEEEELRRQREEELKDKKSKKSSTCQRLENKADCKKNDSKKSDSKKEDNCDAKKYTYCCGEIQTLDDEDLNNPNYSFKMVRLDKECDITPMEVTYTEGGFQPFNPLDACEEDTQFQKTFLPADESTGQKFQIVYLPLKCDFKVTDEVNQLFLPIGDKTMTYMKIKNGCRCKQEASKTNKLESLMAGMEQRLNDLSNMMKKCVSPTKSSIPSVFKEQGIICDVVTEMCFDDPSSSQYKGKYDATSSQLRVYLDPNKPNPKCGPVCPLKIRPKRVCKGTQFTSPCEKTLVSKTPKKSKSPDKSYTANSKMKTTLDTMKNIKSLKSDEIESSVKKSLTTETGDDEGSEDVGGDDEGDDEEGDDEGGDDEGGDDEGGDDEGGDDEGGDDEGGSDEVNESENNRMNKWKMKDIRNVNQNQVKKLKELLNRELEALVPKNDEKKLAIKPTKMQLKLKTMVAENQKRINTLKESFDKKLDEILIKKPTPVTTKNSQFRFLKVHQKMKEAIAQNQSEINSLKELFDSKLNQLQKDPEHLALCLCGKSMEKMKCVECGKNFMSCSACGGSAEKKEDAVKPMNEEANDGGVKENEGEARNEKEEVKEINNNDNIQIFTERNTVGTSRISDPEINLQNRLFEKKRYSLENVDMEKTIEKKQKVTWRICKECKNKW